MGDEAASGLPGRDDAPGAAGNEALGWWPYTAELPGWHVWRGISGLVYARRLNTSPPLVVRGEDAVDLRDAIRREEFLRSL
jgi:hypothetical protein